jgi:Short C-terminal domain/Phospholipase_D-nuclease N-terminal
MQAMVAAIVVDTIGALDLQWPTVSDAEREANAKARAALEAEPDYPVTGTSTEHQSPREDELTMLLAEFGTGQVFWSMLWFFLFFIWIWLLIVIFGDIFRSPDLSGWGKALWSIFIIFLPYLGVFVYLIARGRKMQEHAMDAAKAQDAAFRRYVQDTTQTSTSAADEVERLAKLRDQGIIDENEFQQAKAKALS